MASQHMTEPWLRGAPEGVDPLIAPVLFSFQMAREDLARHTEGLTPAQVWVRPHGMTPLGFQLRHIAGSVTRLMAYVERRQLDQTELDQMKSEADPPANPASEPGDLLLARVEESLGRAEQIVRAIDPSTLREPREVGRKKLPTTVIGLLVHIAEHTQRHVGEAISAAKLARAAT
jgi:hypothetical protein